MDEQMLRNKYIGEYHAYAEILHRSSIPFIEVDDETLANLSLADVQSLTRSLQTLARTPHE